MKSWVHQRISEFADRPRHTDFYNHHSLRQNSQDGKFGEKFSSRSTEQKKSSSRVLMETQVFLNPNIKKFELEKVRIFSVSDIHSDHEENWDLIKSWKNLGFDSKSGLRCFYRDAMNNFEDILIVAGDISTDLDIASETLKFLKEVSLKNFR